MGRKKKLKRGRDVTKILRRNGCHVREGKGSHKVGTLPSGKKIVWYQGKLSTGVRCKLRKALQAAGLIALLLVPFIAGMLAAAGGLDPLLQILALILQA